MSASIDESKRALRREVRAVVRAMGAVERTAASARARELLTTRAEWLRAGSVLFYAPMPEELDVWPLVAQALAGGKVVALPRFVARAGSYIACQVQNPGQDIKTGYFGIREPGDHCLPISLNRLDLILVPGVAFDLLGRRLGRGKGFYDQLLAGLGGVTCGVAFDEQMVSAVPVAPHDIHLNCILTPTRWVGR